MKLRKLKKIVDIYVENLQDYQDPNVVVAVKGSGVGGTPCVDVKSAHVGFDWDSGKFIIHTEGRLLKVDKP